ncbi:MAG: O-antigen ligase family protein, partial [Litorimonas sp.]
MTLRGPLDGAATGWVFFWLAFLAVYIHFGGLAFAGLAILLGVAGWAVWFARRAEVPVLHRGFTWPAAAFTLFFLWLGISGQWSGHGPDTALRLGAQTALAASLPVLFTTRSSGSRTLLSHLVMAMALAGVAVLALDVASGYGINTFLDPIGPDGDLNRRQGEAEMNIGRGHVVYAVMAPLLVALFQTRLPKGRVWPAILVFCALLVIGSQLNRLAIAPIVLMAGLALLAVGWRWPRAGLRLSVGTLVASVALAPLVGVASRVAGPLVADRLPMSWDHRIRMWDYSLARILEAPLFGKGLDSSRTLQDDFTTRIGVDMPFVSLHPHNVGIQTWLETGLVGALLLSLALASLYRPLRRLCA